MKVGVEGIIHVNLDSPSKDTVVTSTLYRRWFPVDFTPKNKKDSGTEVWDWAQKNWPTFILDRVRVEVGEGEGKTFVWGTTRWFCVTAVWRLEDGKRKDLLPMLEPKHFWSKKRGSGAKKPAPVSRPEKKLSKPKKRDMLTGAVEAGSGIMERALEKVMNED